MSYIRYKVKKENLKEREFKPERNKIIEKIFTMRDKRNKHLEQGYWIQMKMATKIDKVIDIDTIKKFAYPWLGHWKCTDPRNPFKVCIYDHFSDSIHDKCLFCGHPEERK